MNLWLDDMRSPDQSWEWVKSASEAIWCLGRSPIVVASLDHDLEHHPTSGHKERTGLTVVEWMVENDTWPTEAIYVHSWNYDGAKRMCDMINAMGPYGWLIRPCPALEIPFKHV
jgi:hypothetical protein